MASAGSAPSATPAWVETWSIRARLVIAALLVWSALHYLVQPFFLPIALDRPIVVTLVGGPAAMLVVLLVVLGGGVVGPWLTARGAPASGTPTLLALAAWVAPAGTMDQYLQLMLPAPDSSPTSAYALLLVEYAYWAVCLAGLAMVERLVRDGSNPLDRAAWRRTLRPWLPANLRAEAPRGLAAGLVSLLVALLLLTWLSGPRVQWTHRGQVYFSVLVAFWAGPQLTWRLLSLHVRRPVWFIAGPFLVGVIGAIAAICLRLPAPYADRVTLVAHPLARPLPIEMTVLGSLAVLHSLRTLRGSGESP